MTEADIQCLKENVDKLVEIRTVDGECLIAKIQIVTDDDEYHVHDVMYEVVSSNQINTYTHLDSAGGYLMDFIDIDSVKSAQQSESVISHGPQNQTFRFCGIPR
jgi:hypothetical protein